MTACGTAAGAKREVRSVSLGSLPHSHSHNLDGKARAAAERAARESYGKLLAFLAARSRDVPGAEDALADAFAAALAVWPARGVPANAEGWLATAARRRLIDGARRRRNAELSTEALQLIGDELMAAEGGGVDPRPAPCADVRLRSSGD